MSGEEQWHQFSDEYKLDQRLDVISVEVWNATMDVKIKQAEALIKELTAQIANKKVSKFKPNDVFDKFARDLKGELTTCEPTRIRAPGSPQDITRPKSRDFQACN